MTTSTTIGLPQTRRRLIARPARRAVAPFDVVLRRADSGFDVVATLAAFALTGGVRLAPAAVVVAAHLLLALSHNQPLPFRLNQDLQVGRIVSAVAIATSASVLTLAHGTVGLGAVAVVTAGACVAGRGLYLALLRQARRNGLVFERALVVGNSLERLGLRQACAQHPEYGIDVIGELDTGDLQQMTRSTADRDDASALVVARGVPLTPEVLGELRWAVTRGYRVMVETARDDRTIPAGEIVDLADARVVCLPFAPLSHRSWLAKRAFDLVVSTALLVLLAPLMAAVAIGVKLASPGPVIFRQPRIGRDGHVFTMYKFRTFPVSHVDDAFSLDHHECPLGFGRFLRRTSIDELPQLLNVVCGQMSIVGPRPERPHFADDLAAKVPGYHERHRVPGGITGLAQVNGYWGNSDIVQRVFHDNVYIDSWKLRRDFWILLRTIPATVRKGLLRRARAQA